ncbi:MAG: hypothetical protein KA314_27460 [Chloroflexi bacterium]|nr:hypothetical protein [Chloroflexota bacterium]MBP8059593.1 hypothetical protein [Chloroflexota bacterium]
METIISRLLALSPQPDALAPIRQSLEGQPLTLRTMLTVGPIVVFSDSSFSGTSQRALFSGVDRHDGRRHW